jgi:hypothetical protein
VPTQLTTCEAAPTRVKAVEGERGQAAVRHHLKDDVLVAVAKGRPKRVGRVGRRAAVEHNGAVGRLHLLRDLLPAAESRHGERVERGKVLLLAAAAAGR